MNYTLKQIKTHLLEMHADAEGGRQDLDILNVIYTLARLRLIEVSEDYDESYYYDNLEVNNEFLTRDNIDEYSKGYLIQLFRPLKYESIKKALKYKFCLLNFYNKNERIDCKMWFNYGYDRLLTK